MRISDWSSDVCSSDLWKRSYHKVAELMSAVVYEDPWLAGGHNGLSNAEYPLRPEDPYPRVKLLRETMRAEGVPEDVPIVMARGVWVLREWNAWLANPELGKNAFKRTVERTVGKKWLRTGRYRGWGREEK